MHLKAATLIWSLIGLWQRDTVDTSSGSYQAGRVVGQVFIVVLILAVAYALYKKFKK